MSWQDMIVSILLLSGVSILLLCCVGVMIGGNPYARLHFIGPATILTPIALLLAVVVQDGFSQSSLKVLLITIAMLITSPVITHATARAVFARSRGNTEPLRKEPGSTGEKEA